MPTLLEMCTEVLDEISSIVTPSYLFGNDDDTARQLIAISNKVGRELVRLPLQHFEREATITTVASTSSYVLPSDFRSMVGDTMWNETTLREVYGAVSAQQWQEFANSGTNSGDDFRFRIRGNSVIIQPTPEAVYSIKYEYRTCNYCYSYAGVEQSTWLSDVDTPLPPSELFIGGIAYYFRKNNGLPYADQEAEYNEILTSVERTNKPHGRINMGSGLVRSRLNIPDTTGGA